MGRDALVIALRHLLAVFHDHERERMAIVCTVVDERLRDRFHALGQLAFGLASAFGAFPAMLLRCFAFAPVMPGSFMVMPGSDRASSQRERLSPEPLFRLAAPEQRHSPALAVDGLGLGPEKTASDGLILIVDLVLVELYEREMQIEGLHVGLVAARDEHRRSEVLSRVTGDYGHQGIEVDASAKDGGQQHSARDSEYSFCFHALEREAQRYTRDRSDRITCRSIGQVRIYIELYLLLARHGVLIVEVLYLCDSLCVYAGPYRNTEVNSQNSERPRHKFSGLILI